MPWPGWARRLPAWVPLAVIGLVVSAVCLLGNARSGLDLSDEGYLWYGVQRVARGDVPVRDFQAYDPGRYYLTAALTSFWGDFSLLAIRRTLILHAAACLFAVGWVVAVSAERRGWVFRTLVALAVVAWITPYFKVDDFLACAILLAALTGLARRPGRLAYALAGLAVGVAAVLGRNHGVYGVAGSLGLMLLLAIDPATRRGVVPGAAAWACGVVAGFLPMLLMLALVPGFAAAMGRSIEEMLQVGTTNLPVPVPWPWTVPALWPPSSYRLGQLSVGLLFVALPVAGLLSLLFVLRQRWRGRAVAPGFVAAAVLMLPYAHYAFARADGLHLAFGILPLVTGALVVAARQGPLLRHGLVALFALGAMFTMTPYYEGTPCRRPAGCVERQIDGATYTIDQPTADRLDLVRQGVASHAPGGTPFLAVPNYPAFYAVLGRRSPIEDIYPVVPRSPAMLAAELERLKSARPGYLFVDTSPLDGNPRYAFEATHADMFRYIVASYDRIPDAQHPQILQFKAR